MYGRARQLSGLCEEAAVYVGRLRRRLEPDTSAAHIADRLAEIIESLAVLVEPSAGELVAWTAPGDEDAVAEALRIVDARQRHLRHLLRPGKAA